MKPSFFLLLITLSSGICSLAQSESREIPSKKIAAENIKGFVDSLRQKILVDTIRFDRKDLIHHNGRTKNKKPYSMLITVNMKYNYRLDIVKGKLVKEFVDKILDSDHIDSIHYITKENAPTLEGSTAKGGWILIDFKPKTKLNLEVGGLKYRKGKKRKGGDNYLQRKEGEIMIRT
ncbi:hypothetical protein [Spongiimicrobium sp. 2-473A-2-J]|uniref:hypothetical protein n=1 Tax=Eudoraea algarum TaxID=3417568 RepID=UPI003D36320C